MRTSFLYFSLLVQLFCALPVLSREYHVYSDDPKMCIISTGEEKAGDVVEAVPFANGCPAFVDVTPPITDKTTKGEVSAINKSGKLYVSLGKDGKTLVWDHKSYKWDFHPATFEPNVYHVITIPGKEGFWFPNEKKRTVEIVEPPLRAQGTAWWLFA